MKRSILAFLVSVTALLGAPAHAEERAITLPSGETLDYERYAADGGRLLLWFASERGLAPAEKQAAAGLAAHGVEVWQFDLVNALFLPQVSRSLDGIPAETVRAVLEQGRATKRGIIVYAEGRAAVPVLRGLAGPQPRRACVLLMHPNLYARADALSGAEYLAFDTLESVDVLVLQPRRSAATPWVAEQLAALSASGAAASLRMLEKLREGFWRREEATAYETGQAERLAESMLDWMGQGICR